MKWKELLSEKRWNAGEPAAARDLRSEIGKDYHRIIESASFRRLQDKTQVFPLDKSDFIRTRLTHSLEVSSIGRSLAENIGESIIGLNKDPEFTAKEKTRLTEVLECAGLLHDIGNPPFGHFGEEAIREWFRNHLADCRWKGKAVTEYLTDEQLSDFCFFEGNAQLLRLVSKLHDSHSGNGMNLTAATLSSVIKYPNTSLELQPNSSNVQKRKMGYLTSETELFRWVQKETGTNGHRSPTAFILEAADDIAYATADIEDAFKKGFFNYDTLLREFSERGVRKNDLKQLQNHYDFARLTGVGNAEEYAVRSWLAEMQDQLIYAATDAFLNDYDAIMSGKRTRELLTEPASEKLLSALKSTAYDYAFTSESIYRTEIAANSILVYLLEHLVPAVLEYQGDAPVGLMTDKFMSIISENYKHVFSETVRGLSETEKVYYRLLLVTDSISGMTDSHARDLYAELKGFTSFFV